MSTLRKIDSGIQLIRAINCKQLRHLHISRWLAKLIERYFHTRFIVTRCYTQRIYTTTNRTAPANLRDIGDRISDDVYFVFNVFITIDGKATERRAVLVDEAFCIIWHNTKPDKLTTAT